MTVTQLQSHSYLLPSMSLWSFICSCCDRKRRFLHRLDSNIDIDKQELCGGKEFRKASTVGRLLLVVMLGAVGIYMCMVGVDKKLLSYQGAQVKPVQNEGGSCPKRSSSVDFFQHYPRPLTYDRYSLNLVHLVHNGQKDNWLGSNLLEHTYNCGVHL